MAILNASQATRSAPRHLTRRIGAVLLSSVLALGMLPMPAFAVGAANTGKDATGGGRD